MGNQAAKLPFNRKNVQRPSGGAEYLQVRGNRRHRILYGDDMVWTFKENLKRCFIKHGIRLTTLSEHIVDGDEMQGLVIKEMGEVIYYLMGLHPMSTMISPAALEINSNVELVNRSSFHNFIGEERGIKWYPSTKSKQPVT